MITLTTDFGTEDSYVGMMKGVILTIKPDVTIVDISHQVRPGAVLDAALMIRNAYSFFPEGTVHVVVVDPGVGSERRPVLVTAGGHFFVGPDNGTFQSIIETHPENKIIHLKNDRFFLPKPSSTFHGRDLFAPVAAHLLSGVAPSEMGSPIHNPTHLKTPSIRREGTSLHGQVVHVDHFGNLITNIHSSEMSNFTKIEDLVIEVGSLSIKGVKKTYSDVPRGNFLALMGSSDFLEIAVNSGRASERFRLDTGNEKKIGLSVEIHPSISFESRA
jgi:S-adenosylmethionine hydrolase